MRIKRFIPQTILAIIMLASSFLLSAANTGSISGKVFDKTSGQPLIGVSVQIEGTNIGAKTDFDGKYLILTVPPGMHRLLFMAIGYEKTVMTEVEVFTDSTSIYNIELKSIVLETGRVVTVLGRRKGIDINQTGTVSIKTANQIHSAPVATVDEILNRETDFSNPLGGRSKGRDKKAIISIPKPSTVQYNMCTPPGHPSTYPPAHGGTAIVNGEPFDAMFFKNYGVNPFVDTEDDHLSTFAIDVDDASFVMTRSYLERGELPPDEAVRVEEFVNHFEYNYEPPFSGRSNRYQSVPFSVHMEGAPSMFGQNSQLLRIGIKGMEIRPEDRKDANLVFVVDVSGSMGREDRLGLVKKALRMLVDELNPRDRVGIVVYGSRAREVLRPTSIAHRQVIIDAINSLHTNGATNADAGIRMGYAMADRMFEPRKINRVILCSDGVANVGRTSAEDIFKEIKRYADRGITLSSIGFGMGNYNDILLEKLGNKGNGHYAYVDDIAEARRVFVDNLTGNLQVIARDVKIQVDFNPQAVRSYRLLGYENRDVDDDKFRDDKEDGGEIGAGHEVTALYEIKFHRHSYQWPEPPMEHMEPVEIINQKIGTVFIRYKNSDQKEVDEIAHAINWGCFGQSFGSASSDFKLAAVAAEFAEIMRKSYWAKGSNLNDVHRLAKEVYNETGRRDVEELITLITLAERLQDTRVER